MSEPKISLMSAEQNLRIPFVKMSGAGNDFVIFDGRKAEINLSPTQIKKISDRKNIGCDQLIILQASFEKGGGLARKSEDGGFVSKLDHSLNHPSAANAAPSLFLLTENSLLLSELQLPKAIVKEGLPDCIMEIYNSDGSLSGACGNATRCVASILLSEKESNSVKIQTAAGILDCWREGDLISVNMGVPNFDWQKIPLAHQTDSQKIPLFNFEFACVNVGNPHAVTFINQALNDADFFAIGPQVETNPLFPQKTNVEFVRILSDDLMEVRVWERGSGETLACGSGACAVAILAIRKNLTKSKKITTRFKGGDLTIEWNGDGSPVIMTGGYQKIFDGVLDGSFL